MFQVWKEEYIKIFSDKGVLILLFGASLFYPIVYSVSYNPEVLSETPIAVIDKSFSGTSRQLIRMIDASPQVKVSAQVSNMEDAKDLFLKGEVHGIVQVPDEFTKQVMRGEQAFINLYTDGSYFLIYKQVYQGVLYASGTMGAGIQMKKLMMKGMPQTQALAQAKGVDHISTGLYNPAGGYGTYAMPAVLILIIQQLFLMSIGMLGGTEKEKGAVHYLLPFGSKRGGALRVLIGKTGAFFSIALIISFYLLFIIVKWFQFPMNGKLLDVFLFSIPFILSVIFLGFILASFFKNRENSMIFLLFTAIPCLFLSGFSWPVEAFPFGFETLSKIIPTTPGILGYLKINQMGASLQEAGKEWFHLWIMAGTYGTIAMFIFSRMIKQAKALHPENN